MNMQYPITVYFDASCELCNSEMQAIKIHDTAHRLNLVDCSAQTFDDTPYQVDGVMRDDMMKFLHVRNSQGDWIKGVEAFELIYRAVGMSAIADLLGGRFTRPLAERAYPWVAHHRQAISWTGVPFLFKFWSRCAAWRADKRSRRCSKGQCSI